MRRTLAVPDRRAFLVSLAASALGAANTLGRTRADVRADVRAGIDELRLGFAGPDDSAPPPSASSAAVRAARGARMGVEEAARAAAMLGRRVTLAADVDARRLVEGQRVQVLLGGFSTPECETLARLADERGVLWLDIGCADDALRGAGCRRHAFHLAPSDAMRRDAAALGAPAPSGANAPAVADRIVAWHASLERFGAEQLNARYRARFGGEMSAEAWLGWLAVKIAWEASARARSTDAARLAEYLERESTRFDGHKGVPLSFRAWDHQLRQPLYLVRGAESAETVTDLPPAPRGDESASAALDRLGVGREASACRWGAP